ncbi:MAG: hypothetical protein MZV70_53280 [Desulfobacterales bacterium]|nr:hypothetical protein [Desulfobacterales bacterium]
MLMGSAYKNKGVQPLLDAVNGLLPCPADVENYALDMDQDEAPGARWRATRTRPLVALAFKLEDRTYGQLTYIRVYQGSLRKGDTIINVRTGKKDQGRPGGAHARRPDGGDRGRSRPATSAPFSASTAPRATPSSPRA